MKKFYRKVYILGILFFIVTTLPAHAAPQCNRQQCSTANLLLKTSNANVTTIRSDLNARLVVIVRNAFPKNQSAIMTQRFKIAEFLETAKKIGPEGEVDTFLISKFLNQFDEMKKKQAALDANAVKEDEPGNDNYIAFRGTLYDLYLVSLELLMHRANDSTGELVNYYDQARKWIGEQHKASGKRLLDAESLQIRENANKSTIGSDSPTPELNILQTLLDFRVGELGKLVIMLTEGYGTGPASCEFWKIEDYVTDAKKANGNTPSQIYRHFLCAVSKQKIAMTAVGPACTGCAELKPRSDPQVVGVRIVSASYGDDDSCDREAKAYFRDQCEDLIFPVKYCLIAATPSDDPKLERGEKCVTNAAAVISQRERTFYKGKALTKVCRFHVNSRRFCHDQAPGQSVTVKFKCSENGKARHEVVGVDQRPISLDCRDP